MFSGVEYWERGDFPFIVCHPKTRDHSGVPNLDVAMPLTKIPADRRSSSRFPIRQDVQYRLVGEPAAAPGSGKVVDISSRGVRFTTESPLPLGAGVQLSVMWPVSLSGGAPLQLVVLGRVVRCDAGEAALAIEKYEFRTRSRAPARSPMGPADVGSVTPC